MLQLHYILCLSENLGLANLETQLLKDKNHMN